MNNIGFTYVLLIGTASDFERQVNSRAKEGFEPCSNVHTYSSEGVVTFCQQWTNKEVELRELTEDKFERLFNDFCEEHLTVEHSFNFARNVAFEFSKFVISKLK